MSARDDYSLVTDDERFDAMCDEIDQQRGLLAECSEWFAHVEQLGYDRVDPTLRAAVAKAVGR